MQLRTPTLTLALAVLTLPSTAQDWKGNGRVEGRVLDPDGKPVAGATVKLANPGRGGGPTVKTDRKGKWAYLGLVAGTWNIDIEAQGLATRQISVTLPSEASRLAPLEVKLEKAKTAGPAPELVEAATRAEEAYKAGRHEEAIAEYEKVLAQRADLAPLLHRRIGFAYIQLKSYEKALDHLDKVAAAEPGDAQLRAIMATAALEGGLTDRGRELLKTVDPATIKDADVLFNIGVNFLNAGRAEDAIAWFTRTVEADPGYTDGYFRRAFAYLQSGRTAEAKADFRKVLELTPEGAQADAARRALEQVK